ncbi:MAG: molybdenum cofactor guanylyltransferase [Nitrospiraceae bacterium]|nr:MAG: molybdenum cofactor guanylyltransferase [Nitrospiraceae bacterium]
MTALIENCTGVILAGGENTRMPLLKAFIEVKGQRIIERNLSILRRIFPDVVIVTNEPEAYSYLGATLLGDAYNTRGPMTGILTALLNSQQPWVFVSACDMPFLSEDFIRAMLSKRSGSHAVVPLLNKRPEPLLAFYAQGLARAMEKALLTGEKRLGDFLNTKRVQYITVADSGACNTDAPLFINLNTPMDVSTHLTAEDRMRFEHQVRRRGKCLD